MIEGFRKHCLRRYVVLEVRRSKDNQFYFILKAANGETMMMSETYTRRTDAHRAADRLKVLVSIAVVVDVTDPKP